MFPTYDRERSQKRTKNVSAAPLADPAVSRDGGGSGPALLTRAATASDDCDEDDPDTLAPLHDCPSCGRAVTSKDRDLAEEAICGFCDDDDAVSWCAACVNDHGNFCGPCAIFSCHGCQLVNVCDTCQEWYCCECSDLQPGLDGMAECRACFRHRPKTGAAAAAGAALALAAAVKQVWCDACGVDCTTAGSLYCQGCGGRYCAACPTVSCDKCHDLHFCEGCIDAKMDAQYHADYCDSCDLYLCEKCTCECEVPIAVDASGTAAAP